MGLRAGGLGRSLAEGRRGASLSSPLGEFGEGRRWEEGRHRGTMGLDPTSFLPKGFRGCPRLGLGRKGSCGFIFVRKVGRLFPKLAGSPPRLFTREGGPGRSGHLAGEMGWPGGAAQCCGVKHVGGGRAPRATASALSCPRPSSLQTTPWPQSPRWSSEVPTLPGLPFFPLPSVPPAWSLSGRGVGGVSSQRLFCKVFVVIFMPPE